MRILKIRRFVILAGICFYLWVVSLLFFNKGLTEIFFRKLTLDELRKTIGKLNEAQVIFNEKQFDPVLEDTMIIAIQVHDRIQYLGHVIKSLSQVGLIQEALLVFSHDVYDEDINRMVRSINFTKVLQIYYPYSIQLYPNEFPGNDPNDCPKVIYGQTVKPGCEKATFYREANFTQIKQHWWWKANRIFNQLDCTENHTGMVLFLEDDHYVAPDILHMMLKLRQAADEECPQCQVLCLGSYARISKYHRDIDKAQITTWYTQVHNMGFVFNRTVWRSIIDTEELFCNHNDYNWDITLLYLSQMRKNGPINVIMASESRVYNFGKCGVHYTRPNCSALRILGKIKRLLKKGKDKFYPPTIEVTMDTGRRRRAKRTKGGGFHDKRDQELCRNMTKIGRQKRNNKVCKGF